MQTPPDQILAGKVKLRPKRLGIGFLLVDVAMLLAAINYGNNLIYLITFLLFSLLINSGWQTKRLLRQLRLSALPPAPRHADQTGRQNLTLHSRYDLVADLAIGDLPVVSQTVLGGRETQVELLLPTAARGHQALPAIRLSSDYPLGLWTASRIDQPLAQAWIYPRSLGDLPLPTPDEHGTGAHNPIRGDDELDHLRPYIPGDSLSRLAFKHYARTGELVTKAFIGQSGASGLVELDFDQVPGDPETRLSQLTHWVLQLKEADRPFSLRLPDAQLPPGQGTTHARQALEALAICRTPHGRARVQTERQTHHRQTRHRQGRGDNVHAADSSRSDQSA